MSEERLQKSRVEVRDPDRAGATGCDEWLHCTVRVHGLGQRLAWPVQQQQIDLLQPEHRSEERRVGKEGRSRGAPEQ